MSVPKTSAQVPVAVFDVNAQCHCSGPRACAQRHCPVLVPGTRCRYPVPGAPVVPGTGTQCQCSVLNVSARFPVSALNVSARCRYPLPGVSAQCQCPVPGVSARCRFPVLTQVSDPRVPVQVGLLLPHGARHRSRSMPRPLLRHETTPTWQICIAPAPRGRGMAAGAGPGRVRDPAA